MLLPKNTILYKRQSLPSTELPSNSIQWFNKTNSIEAVHPDNTYILIFKTTKEIKLMNLGKEKQRNEIIQTTDITKTKLHPDFQYSGHDTNKYIHTRLQHYFSQKYKGTIVYDELNDTALSTDLKGINEIVLFDCTDLEPLTVLDATSNPFYHDFLSHSAEL